VSLSQAESLASLPPSEQAKILADLTEAQAEDLRWDWAFWGRPEQIFPPGDWFIWLIMAGRGWGKTRTATENIAAMLRGPTPLIAPNGAPRLLSFVADTPFDMRQYSIEGPSGFLNIGPPDHRPHYEPSKKTLEWPNGAKALLFSAEDPETTRGASGSFFWWDELAKAKKPDMGWQNMLLGMREGNPRGIVTTTPRPIPLIKRLAKAKSTHLTVASTWDNRPNISATYFSEVISPLMGTRLGRQEVNAEILDDIPGALWTRAMIDRARETRAIPDMVRMVVAVDPSGTKGEEDERSDEVGIVVAGKGTDGRAYIFADRTCKLSPAAWATRVVNAFKEFLADRIVAEVNYGGAMVEQVIRAGNPNLPVIVVTASRGKVQRAEPVARLYEQGRVTHVGNSRDQSSEQPNDLAFLEDQLCQMTPSGYLGDRSPDRADALVWALTDLMLVESEPLNVTDDILRQVAMGW
jgi:phage terminase large subunit-like protein